MGARKNRGIPRWMMLRKLLLVMILKGLFVTPS